MTAAPLYDYDFYQAFDITSCVTVRHAKYNYDLVDRRTEIGGTDRQAYGGRQPATNSAALLDIYRNKQLKCSDCQQSKPLYDFPRLSGCWHRLERGYQCGQCKHLRYLEAKAAAEVTAGVQRQEQKRLSKKERKQARKKLDKRVA